MVLEPRNQTSWLLDGTPSANVRLQIRRGFRPSSEAEGINDPSQPGTGSLRQDSSLFTRPTQQDRHAAPSSMLKPTQRKEAALMADHE